MSWIMGAFRPKRLTTPDLGVKQTFRSSRRPPVSRKTVKLFLNHKGCDTSRLWVFLDIIQSWKSIEKISDFRKHLFTVT